ncbi:MAG: hypothetical protein ACLR8Y_04160 [Alistipes indistinctus]
MTNVANNTLVYKAVAKGLAMLGDQIDKDNRKLIQMLASLDKLQIKLSKGPAGFKQLAKAEKEVDAATQAYAQALHARAAAEQKRTELKKTARYPASAEPGTGQRGPECFTERPSHTGRAKEPGKQSDCERSDPVVRCAEKGSRRLCAL